MVAAHQRQPERAGDEHARDPGGAGRADVDRVEAAVGEQLHGGGEAGDADREAGVVGHVDLGDGGQAQVDLGVGADDLDLEAGDAALADLLDRARDAVHRADPVGEDRHARGLAVVADRAPVELGALVGEEGDGGGVGDRGDAALEQALGGGEHLGLAGGRAHRDVDRRAQLALVQAAGAAEEARVAEVLGLHQLDQPALVEVVELDR